MKRKKLLVFASDIIVFKSNMIELYDFFDDTIEIEIYDIRNMKVKEKSLIGDLAIIIGVMDILSVKKYLRFETEIIVATRTILRESYDKIMNLPAGSKVIVANIHKRAALGLVAFLTEIGILHLDFYPVYYGIDHIPDIDTVIVPSMYILEQEIISNDKLFNPAMLGLTGKKIIDLNTRRITVEVYRSIITLLNIKSNRLEFKLEEYAEKLFDTSLQNIPLSKIYKSEKILTTTIDEIDHGIIIINKNNKIIYINSTLLKILNINKEQADYLYMDEDILPKQIYDVLNDVSDDVDKKMITIDEIGKNLLISKKHIGAKNEDIGNIITIKDVTEIEKLETQLRGMIAKKGYLAKYTFKDVIGNSSSIKECIEIAKKISLIDRPALILGESGTGKEIFAQAMHNNSKRKKYSFVAINCAALSSELLTSELFGYEEGAFTGARKGGKKGLFELAHRGTIFLDEIGDISTDVQVRLLRVLQEHEIRKIGGDEIIPVDVRVIAATNRNLDELVDKGKFRLDLYYRLNAFVLNIPSLKDRIDDIELLIKYILKDIGCEHKKISKELMGALKKYNWRGNVRELKNCIEYMAYMGNDILDIKDLPRIVKINNELKEKQEEDSKDLIKNTGFIDLSASEIQLMEFILKTLNQKRVGRKTLYELCLQNKYNITEYKVRISMEYLNKIGYLKYGRGNSGALITDDGIRYITKRL